MASCWYFSLSTLKANNASISTVNLRKDKGKAHRRTGQRYNSTHSLTLALYGVGGQRQSPAALPVAKRPVIHCIGGWVGPRAGLNGCGKSRSVSDSIPRTVQSVESRYND